MTELGRLERVELRTVWLSEPGGFTPWLAKEENLSLLGKTIDVTLQLEAQERNVGPFRADILCKDLQDDTWVLIENQLEKTDHLHLGQIMTYAAGLDAVTIVWVAGKFVDEHIAAIDWLNRITSDRFRFFGLEIELWRIGASIPAPKFNVVAKPNAWSESVSEAARSIEEGPLGDRKRLYISYWKAFGELLTKEKSTFQIMNPSAKYYINFFLGRSGFTLSPLARFRDKWIGIALVIHNDPSKMFFNILKAERPAIEHELGYSLEWDAQPESKRSRIETRWNGVDPEVEADWPRQHKWLAERLEQMDRVFRSRVRALPLRSESSEEQDADPFGPDKS